VKIPVVQLPEPRSLENVRQALTLIGATLAREAETLAMRKRFDALLERTRERAAQGVARRGGKPPEVLYVGTDLNTPWTAGQNTLADEILQAAGAVNVAARHGVVHEAGLNKEAVLRWEPEILLFDGEPSRRDERLQELEDDRLFAGLRAVREGNVILIPARLITAASHYAAPAAELLCNALYGEAEGP
jgi:ABC-type Fe3+-hydroxamate transport system substrate-binding protein